MESTRFQFLKQVMAPAFSGLCGGDDAHKNYLENVVKLCNYVKAVNQTQLPALNYPFENWDEYAKVFVSVKAQSLTWTNNVVAGLVSLPDVIIDRDADVCELFKNIIESCSNLLEDPDAILLKKRVSKDLVYCMKDIQYVCGLINKILEKLDLFNKSLEEQAAQLKNLADTALEKEQVDRGLIAQLEESIKYTKNEIDSLTESVAALSTGLGICLAVAIGLGFAGPFGYIGSIFVSIIAMSDAIVLGINSKKLDDKKYEMKQLTTQMNGYTLDATALKLIAQSFTDLVVMARNVKDNLEYIHSAWDALLLDLESISAEIEKATNDSLVPQWAEVGADMKAGLEIWKEFIEKVNVLTLEKLTGNTGQLELGMTPEEVKTRLDQGQEVSLMEYLTA